MATEERTKEILKELHNAVCSFEEDDAVKWAKIALAEGVDPFIATMNGLANGMIEEVRMLIDKGIPVDTLLYYGLEYKFITLYLTGKMTYDEMFCRLEVAIHQFAKRQMTWFRSMEKKGSVIHWINGELPMEEKVALVIDLLYQDQLKAEKVESS